MVRSKSKELVKLVKGIIYELGLGIGKPQNTLRWGVKGGGGLLRLSRRLKKKFSVTTKIETSVIKINLSRLR